MFQPFTDQPSPITSPAVISLLLFPSFLLISTFRSSISILAATSLELMNTVAVMTVNLKGVFFTTQRVVRHLQTEKRSGKIINISSVHEELAFPHFTSYCMSKGGLRMMTRNLAIELAPFGITVNSVAPGAIETPINKSLLNNPAELSSLLDNIPLKRLGQPADVAEIVAFLASDKSNYITGTTIFVDGGLLWNYQEQ